MVASSNMEINSVIQVKGTPLLSPNFLKTYRAMDRFSKNRKAHG